MDDYATMNEYKDKIRVAIVYHCVAHYRESIFRLLCQQEANGIEYTIISGDHDHTPSLATVDVSKAKISVAEGGLRWRLVKNKWFGSRFLWQSGVVRLAVTREFDAIIYLGVVYHLSTWASCFLARLTGKKTFMWSHGFLREEKGLKGFVRSTFYRLCDEMLLYHNRARDIFIKRGFNPRKLKVIYNSLDVEKQKQVREKNDKNNIEDMRKSLFKDVSLPILLWIGRLTRQKSLDMILVATEKLDSLNKKVNILFIGDGPEKENLDTLARGLGLSDRVVFYGACHDEDKLGTLIAMADICVAPGEVGLTCMHSLAYGTPVITHDNFDFQMPEYEAIKPGVTGAFFKYKDIDSLAETIDAWISDIQYSRNEIRQNCYKVIDVFYNPAYQVSVINQVIQRYFK